MRVALRPQRADRLDDAQRRTHGALGVVLVRPRVAEVDQHAVAEQLRHVALVGRDRAAATASW